MKTVPVLFSGVVFAYAVVAASSDQFSEERYRMKYGRYTSAEETRRTVVETKRKAAEEYADQACYRHMPHETTLALNASSNENWFRAKFGRSAPIYEGTKEAAEVQMAAHMEECAELGRCPLTHVNAASEGTTRVASNFTETEARLRMKYGRTFGPAERISTTPTMIEKRPMLAAVEHSPCTETCCNGGE